MSTTPGEIIHKLRMREGWSLAVFSCMITTTANGYDSVSVSSLSMIERGLVVNPWPRTKHAIAAAFDLGIDDIWPYQPRVSLFTELPAPPPQEAINRPWDIVGRSDLSGELGVRVSTISSWTYTYDDFPPPIGYASGHPIYDRLHILAWVRIRRPKLYVKLNNTQTTYE